VADLLEGKLIERLQHVHSVDLTFKNTPAAKVPELELPLER
jgi:hypothetical protein